MIIKVTFVSPIFIFQKRNLEEYTYKINVLFNWLRLQFTTLASDHYTLALAN